VVQGDQRDEAIVHRRLTALGAHAGREWYHNHEQVKATLTSYKSGSVLESLRKERAMEDVRTVTGEIVTALWRLVNLFSKKR